MISETITYPGFDGREFTDTFYFNLTKAEVTELQVSEKEGYAEMLERIVNAKDVKEIVANFKKILLASYCIKSDDGRTPIKSEELSRNFGSSEAYSILFMKLIENDDSGAAFIRGILPAGMPEAPKSGLSPEEARARSEATLQGHLSKATITANEVDPNAVLANNAEFNSQAAIDRAELAAYRAAQGATVPQSISERAPQPYDQ